MSETDINPPLLGVQTNYNKKCSARKIITSEPAKLLGKLDFGERLSVGLRGFVQPRGLLDLAQ